MKDIIKNILKSKKKRRERETHSRLVPVIAILLILVPMACVAKNLNQSERKPSEKTATPVQTQNQSKKHTTENPSKLFKENCVSLDQKIDFENYSIHSENMIYDENNLYIPFNIVDIKGNCNFDEFSKILLHVNGKKGCTKSNDSLIHVKDAVGKNIKGAIWITSKVPLKKGNVAFLMEGDQNKEETGKVFAKFKLPKDTPKMEHEIDLSKVKFKKDIVANKISISPFGIKIEGTYKEYTFDDKTVKVILKNGTEVKINRRNMEGINSDNKSVKNPFKCNLQFEYPVDLSQVQEIVMGAELIELDVRIPYKVK